VPFALLPLVMVTSGAVILSRLHTTLPETYGRSRTDRDHSYQVSRRVLSRNGSRGNPRLTLVSDGNPFRRLLLGSKKNSLFTAVSPFKWIARHIRKGKPFDYSTLGILQSTAFA